MREHSDCKQCIYFHQMKSMGSRNLLVHQGDFYQCRNEPHEVLLPQPCLEVRSHHLPNKLGNQVDGQKCKAPSHLYEVLQLSQSECAPPFPLQRAWCKRQAFLFDHQFRQCTYGKIQMVAMNQWHKVSEYRSHSRRQRASRRCQEVLGVTDHQW